MCMSARTIIKEFGGVLAMSEKLSKVGKRVPPTTIQYWQEENVIPTKRQSHILKAARHFEIEFDPLDMLAVAEGDIPEGAAP